MNLGLVLVYVMVAGIENFRANAALSVDAQGSMELESGAHALAGKVHHDANRYSSVPLDGGSEMKHAPSFKDLDTQFPDTVLASSFVETSDTPSDGGFAKVEAKLKALEEKMKADTAEFEAEARAPASSFVQTKAPDGGLLNMHGGPDAGDDTSFAQASELTDPSDSSFAPPYQCPDNEHPCPGENCIGRSMLSADQWADCGPERCSDLDDCPQKCSQGGRRCFSCAYNCPDTPEKGMGFEPRDCITLFSMLQTDHGCARSCIDSTQGWEKASDKPPGGTGKAYAYFVQKYKDLACEGFLNDDDTFDTANMKTWGGAFYGNDGSIARCCDVYDFNCYDGNDEWCVQLDGAPNGDAPGGAGFHYCTNNNDFDWAKGTEKIFPCPTAHDVFCPPSDPPSELSDRVSHTRSQSNASRSGAAPNQWSIGDGGLGGTCFSGHSDFECWGDFTGEWAVAHKVFSEAECTATTAVQTKDCPALGLLDANNAPCSCGRNTCQAGDICRPNTGTCHAAPADHVNELDQCCDNRCKDYCTDDWGKGPADYYYYDADGVGSHRYAAEPAQECKNKEEGQAVDWLGSEAHCGKTCRDMGTCVEEAADHLELTNCCKTRCEVYKSLAFELKFDSDAVPTFKLNASTYKAWLDLKPGLGLESGTNIIRMIPTDTATGNRYAITSVDETEGGTFITLDDGITITETHGVFMSRRLLGDCLRFCRATLPSDGGCADPNSGSALAQLKLTHAAKDSDDNDHDDDHDNDNDNAARWAAPALKEATLASLASDQAERKVDSNGNTRTA